MDDKKDNQEDMTVGEDGSMNKGVNIEVKMDDSADSGPTLNEIKPPPEEAASEDIKEEDANAVESAVNFIVGGDASSAGEVESSPETSDTTDIEAEPASGVVESPVEEPAQKVETDVVEQGLNDVDSTPEEPDADTAESSESVQAASVDPFAPDKPVETVAAVSGMSNNEQAQPHAHRNNKKLAIIVTVFVALIMAGAAVYVFMSAEDNAEESSTANTTVQETQQEAVTPATVNDVDQTISEIDQTLETIDETDLSEETLSDGTLGL